MQIPKGVAINLAVVHLLEWFIRGNSAMWRAVCVSILLAVGLAYVWLRHHYSYWIRLHVPQITPTWFLGNLGKLVRMQQGAADFIRDLYNHPEAAEEPFVGIHLFYKPAILLRDPELIRRILITDFSKFNNRYSNSEYKGDPIGSKNLFFLKNPAWKEVRLRLTPFFTSGKLKQMFHLIENVGRDLDQYLLQLPLANDKKETTSFSLEMKELCALYTTDVIATVAYGVQANSFRNPDGDFRRNGREVFKFRFRRAIEFIIIFFLPHLVPYFRLKVVPTETAQFLRSTINYVKQQRELGGEKRNDLIDILIEFETWSKSKANSSKLRFEGDLLVAQAALFFTAGFETSSATMSFALYELAKRPDLQRRLRNEFKEKLLEYDGRLTQQFLDSLEFMQMVINEVLRLYPPLPFLDRECTADETKGYSLEPFHSFHIPFGMPVYVPVYALHMDPKYYPSPQTFDPERFSLKNKKHLIPYTYMPFGLGPHTCIGERLAMIQTKIGLVYFLRNHYVTTCSKTNIPMKLDPKALIVQAEGGIYLNVVRDPLGV